MLPHKIILLSEKRILIHRRSAAFTLVLLASTRAWAGDLTITSSGSPVVVVRGSEVLGTTPLSLRGLDAGAVELGFRDGPLSATAFTQLVTVPATGAVTLDVNLPERLATAHAEAAATPAPKLPPSTGATASTPPVVPVVSKPAVPSGDVYVSSSPAGALVLLDGAPTGAETPTMLRGLPVGKHTVEPRTRCARSSATVTLAENSIARAELTLVDHAGAVSVTSTVPNTRVLLDGVDLGKAPIAQTDCGCGTHKVALRAPGFLESVADVNVLGYEAVNVAVGTSGGTAPPPQSSGVAHTVSVLLQKEEFGTLVLDVSPLEAHVAVDGIDIGVGPRSIERIAAGPHSVTGTLDGYAPQTLETSVPPQSLARVTLTLERASMPQATAPLGARSA